MYLNVREIPAEGLRVDESIDLTAALAGDDLRIVGRVRLTGEAHPGARGVDLRARLEAGVRLECGRCLEPFERQVRTEFELTLVPEAVEPGAGEIEMAAEDATLFHAAEGKADLRSIAVEQLVLNLPLKTVCRVDCRGLCPTCGANRNRIECACPRAESDPRMAPLRQFLKEIGSP